MSTPNWKTGISRRARVAAVWLVLILAWEAAYRAIGWKPWVFPAPSHVVDATLSMLNIHTYLGEPLGPGWPLANPMPVDDPRAPGTPVIGSPLVSALTYSGLRMAIGFTAALAFGVAAGLLLWRITFVDSLLGPLFLGLQTLPSVCWVPLAILTFGINERGILFVLFMGSAFSMAIAMRDGLRALPPIYRAAGIMLGARGLRLYFRVLLPASLPAFAGTLRQGFSFAWRSLLGAELILLTQRRGIGFLLNVGRDFADVAQVVAVMIVMIAVGMAVDRWCFAIIERRVRTRFGLAQPR